MNNNIYDLMVDQKMTPFTTVPVILVIKVMRVVIMSIYEYDHEYGFYEDKL